ncbi:hypothetical protein [Clostridium perfringens]
MVKDNNSRNGKLNMIYGTISQIVILVFSILIPRYVIITYGSEANGLVNSLNQIYNYASLLEFGVGTASIMTVYKAIAENNKKEMNTIVSTTAHYYKRTGLVYATIVIVVSFLYPIIIKSDLNSKDVIEVALFTGIAYAMNYIIQGKYSVVLQAYGKLYVISSSQMILAVISQLSKLLIMYLGLSIVYLQLSFLILNTLKILLIVLYTKKTFPYISFNGKCDYSLIKEKNYVMVHQISNLIFTSTDSIMLSIFSNLTNVSIYSVYNLVMNAVSSIVVTLSNSYNHLLANKFNTNKNNYIFYHERFETGYYLLVFTVYSTVYMSITKFISIYTNGISNVEYANKGLSILFVIVALLSAIRNPLAKMIDFSKNYKETKNQAILEMIINISITIISIKMFGIYGALIGTIVALLYRSNAIIIYVNHKILNRSTVKTYKKLLINTLVFIMFVIIDYFIKINVNNYFTLIIYSGLVFICSNIIFIICNIIINREEVLWLLKYVDKNFIIFREKVK